LEQDFELVGNLINKIESITIFTDNSIKIDIAAQNILLDNKTYDNVNYIIYNSEENTFHIGNNRGASYWAIYNIEIK
jgi:fructose-1,6-bisphosphatase